MNNHKHHSKFKKIARFGTLLVALMAAAPGHAQTLWTGPTIEFNETSDTPSDTIYAGKVVLTRGGNDVLYNTAAGETGAGDGSPLDTEWAFGDISQSNKLSYQSLESMRNGDLASLIVDQPMVVHLMNEDIYLSLTFSFWGQHGVGGFTYTRSTPGVVTPPTPTISITNPGANAVYAAPASVKIGVSAAVSSGAVTNVSFFGNSSPLGSSQTPPFNFTAGNLAAGSYALTAVATAAGVSATSTVVNVSVVAPVAVSATAPVLSNGQFTFHYSANTGLKYVVERSSNLVTWLPVNTNTASSGSVPFSDTVVSNGSQYYRVGRAPNP